MMYDIIDLAPWGEVRCECGWSSLFCDFAHLRLVAKRPATCRPRVGHVAAMCRLESVTAMRAALVQHGDEDAQRFHPSSQQFHPSSRSFIPTASALEVAASASDCTPICRILTRLSRRSRVSRTRCPFVPLTASLSHWRSRDTEPTSPTCVNR